MSAARDNLWRIISSRHFNDVYRPRHPVDYGKVRAEFAGERRPLPKEPLALGLVNLIRSSPAIPSSPPPSLVFSQDGVFVRRFGNFAHRDVARQHGFKWLALQLDHSADSAHNAAMLITARAEGWIVGGWATFGQGTDARQDGHRQAAIARQHNLSFWIANGEAWAEGIYAGKSAEWWAGWDSNNGAGPVALSCLSSTTSNFGREMDWRPWTARGCTVMPQVYGASHAGYTVGAMVGSFARTSVPPGLLAPTFDVIDGTGAPFADYTTWRGPRSVWTGDDARAGTWPLLEVPA